MKVIWSPTDPDVFLTYSNNIINLYKTKDLEGGPVPKGCLPLSENQCAVCLSSLSDVNSTKCVAWHPGQTAGHIVAIGQDTTGRILITNFGGNEENDLVGKEFVPKHPRHCFYLKWNPVHHHLLAQGLEKQRNDNSIAIWDINMRHSSEYLGERQRYNSNMSEHVITRPLIELGHGETTSSFAWFKNEPKTFVTGIGGKTLKIYDTRDVTKPHLITHTKDVHGVCTDPLHESRVAAYSETHTSIWDVRNFDKPLLTIPADRQVINVDWCPTRSGFLAILCANSVVVKLYDIRHSIIGTDELEPVTFERNIIPVKQHTVSHFDWHPTSENRIITVTPTGQLKDNQIHDKLPISFSVSGKLSWVFNREIHVSECADEGDITSKMKERVLQGYGSHKEDLWNNAVVVADEPHLHALWHWLDLSRKIILSEDRQQRPSRPQPSRYIGVLDLLYGELEGGSDVSSDRITVVWQYPEGTKSNSYNSYNQTMIHHKSEARSKALQLCGWWYNKEESDTGEPLTLLLDSLVTNNLEYERAAAIALFNLKLGKCLEILGAEQVHEENPMLTTCAMALSGFTEEKNALWRKTCVALRQNLRNPYLRAMFAFLSADKDNFEEVLKDDAITPMAIKDRVAFACLYLSDTKLLSYLKELSKQSKLTGDLDGILITGLTNDEGIQVLSRYVDVTSDIQTAALALVYSAPSDILKDDLAVTWIESYRDLLDRWKLWHQRSKFDILRHSKDHLRMQGQVQVTCNFCGKSVACNLTLDSRMRPSSYGSLPPTNKPKITCCPGCRKPLPRCALCLTNLGTPSGASLFQHKDKSDYAGKLSYLDSWFTWCQTCRHGSHSSHFTDWFKDHTECPVTGCNCRCLQVDPYSFHAAEMSAESLPVKE